jgi:sterol desaturase/sphingolipid hydroxylase (fatty acid hydroxylase superfamily)
MRFLELESSKAAYRADFVVYGLAVLGLAAALLLGAPGPAWPLLATAAGGYLLWTVLEYGLHRFVLHGLQPFRAMHEQHHRRPRARIGTPTVVSAPMFALLVFAPAWWLVGTWFASALTLGLLVGYLAYAITHHVCHQGPAHSAWSMRHQRWHARHHQRAATPGCFGVSHRLWDHVFGTALAPFRRPGVPNWYLG